jgi:glycosyltransferase involved in cell wall biosynthesis
MLSHEFPPLGGGAGKNLELLCRALTGRGLSVRVWTEDPGTAKRADHGFAVDYIRTSRTERFDTHFAAMLRFILGALAMGWSARAGKPALIVATLAIPAGLPAWLLSLTYRAPLVVWHLGSDVHAGVPRGPGMIQALLLRIIWSRSRVNFFVSRGLLDMASRHGCRNRLRILPTCPSPEILAQSPEGPEPQGGRYFLFLGRFDPVKNPLLLVQAVKAAKTRGGLGRRVRMVGSGALAAEADNRIAEHGLGQELTREAAVPFERAHELLRSAYALVVPSRIEGFNTTLLEAAHFGVPSVAADTVGINDFVRPGETGLLFPEDDAAGVEVSLIGL